MKDVPLGWASHHSQLAPSSSCLWVRSKLSATAPLHGCFPGANASCHDGHKLCYPLYPWSNAFLCMLLRSWCLFCHSGRKVTRALDNGVFLFSYTTQRVSIVGS